MSLKILFIGGGFPSHFYKLANHLSKNKDLKDFGLWNVKGIKEFEKYESIHLTVIFPYRGIKGDIQRFRIRGVDYICYRSEDDYLVPTLTNKICNTIYKFKTHNRQIVSNLIGAINPDVVHVIGAENPYYSLSALDIPSKIPSIVSLQTLLSYPGFFENYHINKKEYDYKVQIENDVIQKCDYIFCGSKQILEFLISKGVESQKCYQLPIAVGVDVDRSENYKEYDFVYFAANISKACDWAIEAFALLLKKKSGLTLNVSGHYSEEYKTLIDKRIQELGISKNVIFTGAKETSKDVIRQIKKSRYALLPLKVDMISGTIREAMACGLPVVTTYTPATPELNKTRESVLLSEKGDFETMAQNMYKLVSDSKYAELIKENAYKTISEKYSNAKIMEDWKVAYYDIVHRFNSKTTSIL